MTRSSLKTQRLKMERHRQSEVQSKKKKKNALYVSRCKVVVDFATTKKKKNQKKKKKQETMLYKRVESENSLKKCPVFLA